MAVSFPHCHRAWQASPKLACPGVLTGEAGQSGFGSKHAGGRCPKPMYFLNDNVQRVSDDDDDDDEPRDCWAAYFQTAFVLEPGWLELFNKLCSLEGTASFLLDRKQRHLIG